MCNNYEYNCSCFMNVIEQLYCDIVTTRSANWLTFDVHFSLRKQITGKNGVSCYVALSADSNDTKHDMLQATRNLKAVSRLA